MIKSNMSKQIINLIGLTAVLFFANCRNTTMDTSAPEEVISLNAAAGNGQITLTWTDPADDDFDHVLINYGVDGTADTAFGGTISSSGTTIENLNNDIDYLFMVQTVDASGNISSGVTITSTPDGSAPDEVTGLNAVAGNGQVILSWTNPANEDFDHVKISYGTGSNVNTVFSDTANSAATVIPGLTNLMEHTFVVKTVNTKGSESSGTTLKTTPGFITYDGGNGADSGNSVAIDANGMVFIAGYVTSGTDKNMALWRYTSSGVIDTSFGTGGIVMYSNTNGNDAGRSIVIDADGKIVIAGEVSNGTDNDMALWRYLSSGVLDTSFGTGGVVIYDSGSGDDNGFSVVIDDSGNVVVSGSLSNGTDKDVALWRYTSSGVLDAGFGTGGVVIYDGGNGDDYGRSAKIDATGNVHITGEITNTNKDMAVLRYTSSGVLDAVFGTDGVVTYDNSIADIGYSLAIDTNGKLLIAGFIFGSDSFDRYLWRYLSSGQIDSSFGTDGIATYSSGKGADMGYSLAVDTTGKIIVSGYINNGTDMDMTVLRYTSSGTLDTNFGTNGAVTYFGGNGNDTGLSTAVDDSGNIVVTGYYSNDTDQDMAIWYVD